MFLFKHSQNLKPISFGLYFRIYAKKDGRRCTPASFWGARTKKKSYCIIKYAQMNSILNPLDLPKL
jgi:hypothetical protein